MHIDRIDLITIRMPLSAPFTTSFSTQTERCPLLVRAVASESGETVVGWGECVALAEPYYSPSIWRVPGTCCSASSSPRCSNGRPRAGR